MATQYRRCFSTTNSTQLRGGAPPKFLTSNTHGEEGMMRAACNSALDGWMKRWMDGWMAEGTRGLNDYCPEATKAIQDQEKKNIKVYID